MAEITAANAADVAAAVAERDAAAAGECPSSVRRSLTLRKYAAAMIRAQKAMKNPGKDAQNTHLKNWYADLPAVLDAVMPALLDAGFMVHQFPCEAVGGPALTTLVVHAESGEWTETTVLLRGKTDPQGVGSGVTYFRRYTLLALAGRAATDDDDDGNAARPAPAAQAPHAADVPPAAVARLSAAYATAATPDQFRTLEAQRATLWAGLSTDQKAAIKSVVESTRDRLGLGRQTVHA